MKTAIINSLKNLPSKPELQFNEVLQLYRTSPNANAQTVRHLNTAGYTKINLQNLLYDLKQLHNITDAELRAAKRKQKVIVLNDAVIIETVADLAKYSFDQIVEWAMSQGVELAQIPKWSKGPAGNRERKDFVEKHEIEVAGKKNADYDVAILDWASKNNGDLIEAILAVNDLPVVDPIEVTAATKEEVFTTAPDDVKESIKLKDEFPFLKDSKTCPEEFYVLVGHKFNHYDAYVAAHAALLSTVPFDGETRVEMTPEEIGELSLAAVADFEINQAIYAELQHYAETGIILGAHPIFIERKLKESVEALNAGTCGKRITNLENYIRRDTKNAEKAEGEDKLKYEHKVVEWNIELNMIKTKFNISE